MQTLSSLHLIRILLLIFYFILSLHFNPGLQSAVCILLSSVCILSPVCSLQSAFYSQCAFYPWSTVCSLHFTLSLHFTPGLWCAVYILIPFCSLQSAFYTDRERRYFFTCFGKSCSSYCTLFLIPDMDRLNRDQTNNLWPLGGNCFKTKQS